MLVAGAVFAHTGSQIYWLSYSSLYLTSSPSIICPRTWSISIIDQTEYYQRFIYWIIFFLVDPKMISCVLCSIYRKEVITAGCSPYRSYKRGRQQPPFNVGCCSPVCSHRIADILTWVRCHTKKSLNRMFGLQLFQQSLHIWIWGLNSFTDGLY